MVGDIDGGEWIAILTINMWLYGSNAVDADVAEPQCSYSAMLWFLPLGRASSETTSDVFNPRGGGTSELNTTHDDPRESVERCPTIIQLPQPVAIPGCTQTIRRLGPLRALAATQRRLVRLGSTPPGNDPPTPSTGFARLPANPHTQ